MSARLRAGGLFASLWIAMTLAACARASVVDSDSGAVVTTVFWAIVQGAGLWFAWKNDGPPPRKATDTIAGIGMVAFLVMLQAAGLAQALMTLLLWLQAARNPTIRTRRDAYFTLALGVALVAFGAAETHSTAFLLALAGYGLASMVAMVHCHQQAGFESQGAVPAATGWHTSLSFAHLFALCSVVVVSAAAWYLLVPRPVPLQFGGVSGRNGDKYRNAEWEQEADGVRPKRRNPFLSADPPRQSTPPPSSEPNPSPSNSSGRARPPAKAPESRTSDGSTTEPPLDITRGGGEGDGVPANAIVMYVQAEGPLYLRERTFDRFDDDRWTRTEASTRKLKPVDGSFRLEAPDGDEFRYVVQLVRPRKGNAMALAPHAKRITAPASVIAVAGDHAVYLPARMDPGFRYAAVSVRPRAEPRPVSLDPPGSRDAYLQVPPALSPRVRELADSVTASARSPLDKAIAIEAHLRSHYAYSFATVLTSQGVTPLEDFLFNTRRGHCEFFASAMAIMLREEGIPARVVNGVLAHSYNPVTGFFEVRAFDGHAWVEAYLPGHGWVTFEPTAAYPLPPREPVPATALEQLKEYTERLARQEKLEGLRTRMPTIADVVSELNAGWQALVLEIRLLAEAMQAWIHAHAVVLAAAGAAMAAAAALGVRERATLAWWLARATVRFAGRRSVAVAAMRQLSRVGRSPQLRRNPGETVDEFMERLAARWPDLHPELQTLRSEFNARRYDAATSGAARGDIVVAFESVGALLAQAR